MRGAKRVEGWSWLGLGVSGSRGLGATPTPRPRDLTTPLPLPLLRPIPHRNLVPRAKSLRHHPPPRGRRSDLDRHRLELRAVPAVDELLPLLLPDGLARGGERAGAAP